MSRAVRVAPRARREIRANATWLAERSRRAADRWQDAIEAAIAGLATTAGRHPRYDRETPGRDFRLMLHGRRRSVYRVYFEITDDTVTVHRVLHASQDDPDPETF